MFIRKKIKKKVNNIEYKTLKTNSSQQGKKLAEVWNQKKKKNIFKLS